MQSFVAALETHIDWRQPAFQHACLMVALAPFIWNIVARLEYYFKVLRTIFCGSRYTACYALGTWIFCFSIYRDLAVDWAIQAQSHAPLLPASAHQRLSVLLPPSFAVSADALHSLLGGLVLACGSVLVVSSMWKLGFTGTYLGDYCGIYMDAMVQGFPFNTMGNPMYNGSTLCFLGRAIMAQSPAGVALAAVVFVVYRIALLFEGPFTTMIYRLKAERAAAAVKTKSG